MARRETQLPQGDTQAEGRALDDALAAQFDESGHWREAVPVWEEPEQQAERRQMMAALEGCMGCLPAQTRRVFMMREWLGFENEEIRERLGLSADNVRTILHRARMSLRHCMQQRWFGSDRQGAARA